MKTNGQLDGSAFAWTAHPAVERAAHAAAAAVIIAALSSLVAVLMEGVAWGVGAAAVLLLALNRFFFPSRFAIDDEGITARYPLRRQRLRWPDLRRAAVDAHGVYLSTRAQPSRLDAYRGMHVYFGRRREDVLSRLRARLPEGARSWAS